MTLAEACQFNDSSLTELECVLQSLSDSQYQNHSSAVSSSIGTHVRHIIEFYQCFFKGLDFGVIDYDNRPRNIELEESIELAVDYLKNVRLMLNSPTVDNHQGTVEIFAVLDTDNSIQTSSNVSRELLFLQGHTTHHLAMIALLMEQGGMKVPKNFGVAASTRLHRAVQTA
ncbi:hypothetical protein EOPP23_01800 [Endozoicomonas sp. OPT23]|uniref:DinB family protein n=1 Tax=Endozoicomonas sp. OPT23 TaxID=2072845 RepID=UPI00129B82E2|nr:DinB family protein [Endozoicomonas sp. OPT23]MRI31729.1 hypothetical protein [Endozoicomonas sp. OPT23]